ncbi:MAG: hypothetical protein ABR595_05765 [Psychroflexus sp.]
MMIGYLFFFFVDKKQLYLRIEPTYVQVKQLFGTRIYFNEIKHIEDSSHFLVLKTKTNQIRIDKNIIEAEALKLIYTNIKSEVV